MMKKLKTKNGGGNPPPPHGDRVKKIRTQDKIGKKWFDSISNDLVEWTKKLNKLRSKMNKE